MKVNKKLFIIIGCVVLFSAMTGTILYALLLNNDNAPIKNNSNETSLINDNRYSDEENAFINREKTKESDTTTYVSGSIELGGTDLFSYEPKYRYCYYVLPSSIYELVNVPNLDELIDDIMNGDINKVHDTMALKEVFIRFQIPKDRFVKSMEDMKNDYLESGYDISSEENEIPNANIIYTFDDKIISEYYQRK